MTAEVNELVDEVTAEVNKVVEEVTVVVNEVFEELTVNVEIVELPIADEEIVFNGVALDADVEDAVAEGVAEDEVVQVIFAYVK